MVVEVAFAEWTHEDILRQPSYLAERDDKNPKKVVRETNGRVAEFTAAILTLERVDDAEGARLDRLDHELRDPVAAVDLVGASGRCSRAPPSARRCIPRG